MTTNKLMNQNLYQQKMNQSASELFPFKKQSSIIPYQKQLFQPPYHQQYQQSFQQQNYYQQQIDPNLIPFQKPQFQQQYQQQMNQIPIQAQNQQYEQIALNQQQGQQQMQSYVGHKIKLQHIEKFDELILANDEIKDSINGIKFQIDNIIKISSTDYSIKNQLKNINRMLNMINDDIKKNNEKIKNLFFVNNNINEEDEINLDNNKINSNNISEILNNNVDCGINNNKNIISSSYISYNKEKIAKYKSRNLIKNIKSNAISKLLFSYLDEKIKLKSIKYNKNLQSKIGISLKNYKFYSGKYIIYETKGKGKEYSGHDDILIFEGEYLNGEILKGKGKEYGYNGEILFEGEYINGKRRKGKEYNYEEELLFEGEYLNGKKWKGKGKKKEIIK